MLKSFNIYANWTIKYQDFSKSYIVVFILEKRVLFVMSFIYKITY